MRRIRQRMEKGIDLLELGTFTFCTHYEELSGPHRGRWVVPPRPHADVVMLYLHGGGYAFGSSTTHRYLADRLCRHSDVRAFVLDYPLAPEHPFPAALDDAIACVRWLRQNYRHIVLAGDSAGGGLALATQLRLRDEGEPLPVATAVMSPWTDLTASGDSIRANAQIDPFLDADGLEPLISAYAGDHDRAAPYISPLFGDYTGTGPLFIQVGEEEILLDDSRRLAQRARDAGVDVTLEVAPRQVHAFAFFARVSRRCHDGLLRVARFIGDAAASTTA